MKKILCSIVCVILIIVLAGCSSTSPKSVANDYLNAIKTKDESTMKELANDDFFDKNVIQEVYLDSNDEQVKEIFDMMLEFEYSVISEEIKDDTATVRVKILTYNFGDKFKDAFNEVMMESISSMFTGGLTEEEVNRIIYSNLTSAKKEYESEFDINLIKKENKWIVDMTNNEKLMDSFVGGWISEYKNLEDKFK